MRVEQMTILEEGSYVRNMYYEMEMAFKIGDRKVNVRNRVD